ncbi:MAG: HPF/RaiA family ribosome-associated protein, partial [Actinomycetota bacterium]|nr:HPF/RaiA family ribosome-associated protein [Actinomycetota bacterium]
VIRARESSTDMKASIDLLVDKLERQTQRLRAKRRRGGGRPHEPGPEARAAPETREPVIMKTKQFAVKPMNPEEAVLQLELIGHDFFVFQNDETDDVNVVYRRRDGNYGLIEPQAL